MKNHRADFDQIFRELDSVGLEPEILSKVGGRPLYSGVAADSRRVTKDDIFCAIKGAKNDGHALLQDVAETSTLLIVERAVDVTTLANASIIKVKSTRGAWATLASFFADHPANKLIMVGITGTNGKTSTTWLLREIFTGLGIKSGSIGTLGFFAGEEHIESAHTTPDPDVLYPMLSSFVTKGLTHVVMEVSSHSLAQGKVWPIMFDACAFTSFSQDHLDFHSSMDEYLSAKLLLFSRHLKDGGIPLVHQKVLEWPAAKMEMARLPHGYLSYGHHSTSANFRVRSDSNFKQGFSRVVVESTEDMSSTLTLPMVGDVFCENFSAGLILATQLLNSKLSIISQRIGPSQIKPVPGRLELVRTSQKPWRPSVYVDYAHTPDALEKSIANLSSTPKSIMTVFGCGGDRDKTKRPIMGDIAARLSSKVTITSDNPRSENPATIIEDILAGVADKSNVESIIDRRVAIRQSIAGCTAQTPILIAGKGHEPYQIIGSKSFPFSDQKEALAVLEESKAWLVVGAGVTGFAAAKLLSQAKEKVYLYDDKPIQIPEYLKDLTSVVTAEDVPWSKVDLVVSSPGFSREHPILVAAAQNSKEIISEIDLGLDCYRGSIIGVTGTNGKSTTVSMIEFILRSKGVDADACGNIGIPPSSIPIWKKSDRHVCVLELSSYQLDGSSVWPTSAAAITSFSADHLTRHKTMSGYFAAKWRLTKWLEPSSVLVLAQDVAEFALREGFLWPNCRTIIVRKNNDIIATPAGCEFAEIIGGQLEFGGWQLQFNHLGIQGEHNQFNAFAAVILASHVMGISPQELMPILRQYKGLPYRCEVVFEDGQRTIINDSKSTNLESTLAAMSMAKRPVILMMGGQGKGEPYDDLSQVKDKIATLITFGHSSRIIADQSPGGVPVESFDKMAPAVLRALNLAKHHNLDVIFSPGCASFDEFRNFEHRGAVFTQMVADHALA
jgi:UDP-N-acetylmuramoylalanine--D-glutamate ligase